MPLEVLGTYSSSSREKLGTGSTARQAVSKVYWLALQIDEDTYRLHVLNDEHLPSNVKLEVQGKEIINSYTPEPEYFLETFIPAVQALLHANNESKLLFFLDALHLEVAPGDTPRHCLETNLAALFGDKNNLIREQRDHLNTFGMKSRRSNLLDEALAYYQKSLDLNPKNEKLLFNVARVYFDQNNIAESMHYLNKALEIQPDFPEAKKFLTFLQKFQSSE